MASPQWQLDPTRREYYYVDLTQRAYVYQNGRIIPLPAEAGATDARTPRTVGWSGTGATDPAKQLTDQYSNLTIGQQTAGGTNPTNVSYTTYQARSITGSQAGTTASGYPKYGPNPAGSSTTAGPAGNAGYGGTAYGSSSYVGIPQAGYGGVSYGTAGHGGVSYGTAGYGGTTHGAPSYGSGNANARDPLQREPAAEITDPTLLQIGVKAHGKIPNEIPDVSTKSALFSSFKRQKKPASFFKVGKVFRIMWPEPLGKPNDNVTVVTAGSRFAGEEIATKIRWFVVVKEGHNSCSCLPILTYGGQGCAKPGVIKWQHAIIYSTRKEPKPHKSELPGVKERGMLMSIRVNARSRQDKLDSRSRINFAKIYTVEHYVKVYDFGNVHDKWVHLLRHQWVEILKLDSQGKLDQTFSGGGRAAEEESEEEDEDEENEEGDGDDDDDEDDDDEGGDDDEREET